MNDQDFSQKIIVSGINPSSSLGLHIGNYFGAGKQHVELQDKAKKAFYFIADYHSLNTVFDPKIVRSNVLNTYLDYLSFGLKPEQENVLFYIESAIPEIAELNIILNNAVSMSELNSMHAFKDKLASDVDYAAINHGLFNYPVLMAADILIFNADIVPVGEDQAQHVEITRDIAQHFNARYGDVLALPSLLINKTAARIIGTDGERKMSKSLGNHVPIFAPEVEVKKQIMNITTDPGRIHADDPGDPEKNIIFSYMNLMDFPNDKKIEFENRYREGTIGDVEIKNEFFNFFMDYFKVMRETRTMYQKNESEVREMIEVNNSEARELAQQTLEKVRKAIGFMPYTKVKKQFATIDDFAILDIRIGEIVSAEIIPDADKLLKIKINFGEFERQVLAGIAQMVPNPDDLVGKQVPVIVNLEPRMMRGLESQGMIVATDDADNKVVLMHPERLVPNGAKLR